MRGIHRTFVLLEVPILSKHVKQDFNKSNNTLKKDNKYPTVWYCFLYQKNKCSMDSPHSVMIRGVNREVRHFCATCYKVDKIQRVHPHILQNHDNHVNISL
jgi:hypothetical protein